MKKIAFVLTVVLISSCSAKDLLKNDPEVIQKGTTLVTATFSGSHLWSGDDAVGIYGSVKGNNARYVPMNSYLGKEGEARLYGQAVEGEIVAYYPYSSDGMPSVKEGWIQLPQTQRYCSDGLSQIASNAVVASHADDGRFEFRYMVGAIHFRVTAKFSGEVKWVTLSSLADALCGDMSVSDGTMSPTAPKRVDVRGIGKPEGEFDLWVMLPAASYTGLELTIVSDEGEVTKAVKGTIPVESGKVAETVLKDEAYEYSGSQYEVIPGKFD